MKQTTPIEIGITVGDLPRMLTFYETVLGCRETRRSEIDAGLSAALALAPNGYLCVWLETPLGERIKLMSAPETPRESSPESFTTAQRGMGYLTFYCSDLQTTLAAAEAHGARLRSDRALAEGDAPVRLCFFEDPEGNVIELVEREGGGRA